MSTINTCTAVGPHVALILVQGSFPLQPQVDKELEKLHQQVSHARLQIGITNEQ